jgi:hypothetical protein
LEPAVQAKKDLADKEKLLSEREKEVVSVNEVRKQLQRQNSELGNNMKAQELRLLELETIIKTQQEAYKTLQADLESQREEFSHAKEEVNKAREDFLRQKELSEKLRKEIAKQTPTISQDEIEDLEEELARSKKEISKLKQQLSATGRTQELDQLRQENKRLTALIARNKLGQYAANGNSQEGDKSSYDIPPDSRVMRNGPSNLRAAPIAAQVSIAEDVDDDEDYEDESEDGDDDYEYEPRFSGDEVGSVMAPKLARVIGSDCSIRSLGIENPRGRSFDRRDCGQAGPKLEYSVSERRPRLATTGGIFV